MQRPSVVQFQGDNTTNGAQNINALLDARPDAVNPIIGYNILPTAKTLTDLKAGQTLDTTDTAKSGTSVNGAPQTLQITVNSNTGTTAQVTMLLWLTPWCMLLTLYLAGLYVNRWGCFCLKMVSVSQQCLQLMTSSFRSQSGGASPQNAFT